MDLLLGNQPSGDRDAGWIKDADQRSFMVDVIEASQHKPVIVDFWAPWCGPCKQLGPLLEKVVRRHKGAVLMVKINVDQNQALAAQMRVQSIPAVFAFVQGRPVDGFSGALPESQLNAFVESVLRSAGGGDDAVDWEQISAEASEFLAQGDVETALAIYQEILAQDPQNLDAIAGTLSCYMYLSRFDLIDAELAGLSAEQLAHPKIGAVKSALALSRQAHSLEEKSVLENRIVQNPADHQARFDLAIIEFAAGRRDRAIEHLLQSIKQDRMWNDGAARKELLRFFEILGDSDPLTSSARRRLSAILFS